MSSTSHLQIAFDVPAVMRDGTTLRANVYAPGPGKWPTLLIRTPYGKDTHHDTLTWLDPVWACRAGFLVVVQDTRGRFTSDGEWQPFAHERTDGYDTVRWAARLEHSNGHVGMAGPSYMGNAQWSAAAEQPPELKAIAPALTWRNADDGLFSRGGALELGLSLSWSLMTAIGHLQRKDPIDDGVAGQVVADLDALDQRGYWHLPAADAWSPYAHLAPDLGTFTNSRDGRKTSCDVPVGARRLPAFNIAGWYDLFLQGTIDNYVADQSGTSRLIIGPWHHQPPFSDPIGDLTFGAAASRLGAPTQRDGDLNEEQLAWLRKHLEHAAPSEAGDPVRIFVQGINRWRDEAQWPLRRAEDQRWFLQGDGTLNRRLPPPEAPASTYSYDPADPVLTAGGAILMSPNHRPGPLDQRDTETRPDVITFTSQPLAESLEVTGRVRVTLHAVSSARSTDWVARLCHVDPRGRSIGVCDGITRLHRDADTLQEVEIDLWSTSIVFEAGHRIRVQVTSSNFPRWDRNHNTGDQSRPLLETARQQVSHCSRFPSWIDLPIVN